MGYLPHHIQQGPPTMKIYIDRLSGDEFGSDSYKETIVDGVFYCLEAKMVSESGGIDASLIGGNASAEGGGEGGADDTSVKKLNIVLSHQLQELPMGAEDYKGALKPFLKKVKAHLEENEPDRVESFMKEAQVAAKRIMKLLKKGQVDLYVGESFDCEGMLAILEWREIDGEEKPCLLVWKDCVNIRKV